LLIEIGPNPVLLGLGRRCLPEDSGLWVPSLREERESWQQLLAGLGMLYTHGVEVDWARFDRDYRRRRTILPTYPFQRERYWVEAGGADQLHMPELLTPTAEDGQPPQGQAAERTSMTQRLEGAQPAIRRHLLTEQVRTIAAQVLGLSAARLSNLQQGFFDLGMDSLMAVELRKKLEHSFGRTLSTTLAFDYPNVEALSAYLYRELEFE